MMDQCALRLIWAVVAAPLLPMLGTAQSKEGSPPPNLVFVATPKRTRFSAHEKVDFVFRIQNAGQGQALVARPFLLDHYVWVRVTGPSGKEVPWCGKIDGRLETEKDFRILGPGGYAEATVTLSCDKHKDAGYIFDRPGRYVVNADYHLPQPKVWLKQMAGRAQVSSGPVKAHPAEFWIAPSEGREGAR